MQRIAIPQWHPANQTSSTSVTCSCPCKYVFSKSRVVWRLGLGRGICPFFTPSWTSWGVGLFQKLGLKRTRCSSNARAWRKCLTCVFDVVNGRRLGIIPTDPTVSLHFMIMNEDASGRGKFGDYQTPRSSMSTSIENAFLNAVLWRHPRASSRQYILYAKGTCWWLLLGRRPTYSTASEM